VETAEDGSGQVDWEAVRAEFPITRRLVFLNASSRGPMPLRAHRAMTEELDFLLENDPTPWERNLGPLDDARRAMAGFIGADPEDLALTCSVSDGVAHLASSMPLSAGDELRPRKSGDESSDP